MLMLIHDVADLCVCVSFVVCLCEGVKERLRDGWD